MSSIVNVVGDLSDEIADPGVVTSIQKHVADGCPLAPLVEAVTPDYTPEERPRLIAAMVEKARAVIAHQNEHAANDHGGNCSADAEELHSAPRKRGRPRSEERAAVQAVAKAKGISEDTVRRDLAKLAPPAEPLVPKPAKPKPVEERLAALVEPLQAINAEMNEIRHSMDEAAKQFKWTANDVRWRFLQELGRANAQVSSAGIGCKELSERMRAAKTKVFTDPVTKLGDKPLPAHKPRQANIEERIASGGGLKAPARPKRQVQVVDENDRPLLPSEEEIKRSWDEGAAVFGPDGETEDEGAF